MSYFKSLRFKLMLLAVLTGTAVSFACIAVSVYMANRIKDMAVVAYTAAASGAESNLLRAIENVDLDLNWMIGLWIIVWIAVFVCLFLPVTISIKKIIIPIRDSIKHANKLAEGDVYIDVTQNRSDEIGLLQASFQKLVYANRRQAELIRRISEGDLTADAELLSDKDVVGLSLQKMLSNLNGMFGEIHNSAVQVSYGSKQVADGAQAIAMGSAEQAEAIQELSGSVSDITEKTKINADTAEKAALLAGAIIGKAKNGSRQMDQMMAAVREINEAGKSIGKVIKTIDDIAFQTNILALNAAVEAARAGQHGKGFAVVAEEVRNLASKSAEAAKDTGIMIQNSIEKAEFGAGIANETAASLTEIVSGINESSELIDEIAKLSKEQSCGIEQINAGIGRVAQVVRHNSATAEESAAASEEMTGQSDLLEELVSGLRLKAAADRRSLPPADRSCE